MNITQIKHGSPEPPVREGYGTFAVLQQTMGRVKPLVGTVVDLVNTPRGFRNYGHTSSRNVSGPRGNLKNHEFCTF